MRDLSLPGICVLRPLGEGGMGTVYLAHQTEPVERDVALKVMNSRLSGPRALARFRQEQQTLARLTHAHIAQLYDAGTTESGEPYFLMEYVDGVRIDEYAKSRRLTLDARLELFAQTCRAVQFAHQRGILHRDIKPANLLVQDDGHTPSVKLIDFGIARVFDEAQEGDASLTGAQAVGTPAYMPPEAFDSSLAPDIRLDVYSLGLVLLELVSGANPLHGKSVVDVARAHAETRTVDPAAAWRSIDASTQTVLLEERKVGRHAMLETLQGDLGAIIRKATQHDPELRYDSVSHLADEIDRYRGGYPVEARAPSATYRFWKLVNRHRVAAVATVLVGLSLLTGIGFATREAHRANREAEIAAAATSFLVELFERSDPSKSRGRDVTVEEALREGAKRILDSSSELRPELRSELALTIGQVYYTLGAFDDAEALLTLARELAPKGSADEALAQCELGKVFADRRTKDDAPVAAIERCLELRRAREAEPTDIALARSLLAYELCKEGDLERCLEEARAASEVLGRSPEHLSDYVSTLQNMGAAQSRLERWSAAESTLDRGIAVARELGPEGERRLALILNELALHHMRRGEPRRAITTSEEVLRVYESMLGDEHPEIATMLHNIALQKRDAGQAEAALPMIERAIALDAKHFGADHWTVGYDQRGKALVLLSLERVTEAERWVESGLQIVSAALGPEHLRTMVVNLTRARIYAEQGRQRDALALARAAHAVFVAQEGESSKRSKDAEELIRALETTLASSD